MDEEGAESEPIHLEFADALELYAAIVGGMSTQVTDPEQLAQLMRDAMRPIPEPR